MYRVPSCPPLTGYLQVARELPGAPKRTHLGPSLLGKRMGDQLAIPAMGYGLSTYVGTYVMALAGM